MMKVYIYRDGLCDPLKNIGTCRQFDNTKDLDSFVQSFVASMKITGMSRFRIFITNDNIEFEVVDHYVLMNENLTAGQSMERDVKEVDIVAMKREVDEALKRKLDARDKVIEGFKK